jgi:UDP-glucose 6-dehydrogenase
MKQKHHPDIQYCETRTQALKNSDAALLVTDWPEFNQITRKELKQMNNPIILEGMRPDYELSEENTEGVTWP